MNHSCQTETKEAGVSASPRLLRFRDAVERIADADSHVAGLWRDYLKCCELRGGALERAEGAHLRLQEYEEALLGIEVELIELLLLREGESEEDATDFETLKENP